MSNLLTLVIQEWHRQRTVVNLVASENYVPLRVRLLAATATMNKYGEGYPDKRYYGGCSVVDKIETLCQERFQKLYNTDYHVNVQPYSGSGANQAAYMAVLQPGDTVLAMGLNDGGHLSHGAKVSFSGKTYNFVPYKLNKSGFIDRADVEAKAKELKPKLIVAGASAYSRFINYREFARIAHENGALLMVDMAHIAGLIAGGKHLSPFGYADIITTTTQKTLRSVRGGVIFCRPELAKKIDSAVFPGTQGGPHFNDICCKAASARLAMKRSFKRYAARVVSNAEAMADEFKRLGYKVVTNGTDNHLFLLDFSETHPNITGLMVQQACEEHRIILNKNMVPNDKRKPSETSGVRIGTAAMTTRGYKVKDFVRVADAIDEIIRGL